MGADCVPLLANLFLFCYECIQVYEETYQEQHNIGLKN